MDSVQARAYLDSSPTDPVPDERKQREILFHNHRFATGTRGTSLVEGDEGVDKYYTIVERSRSFYYDVIRKDCQGRRVLEYGCGTGSHSFNLARMKADVTGIDISDVAVKAARDAAVAEHLDHLSFEVMDAESLRFGSETFDLICGTAILHHLDLEKAFSELARTLKPSGQCVFLEPLGHNPLINLYRWLTPNVRTPDEHPLVMKDFRLARQYFQRVELRCFHLFSLLAVPFRRRRLFQPLLGCLDRLDAALFGALPFMKRYGWAVVVVLAQPRKGGK